jgi:hypothetical protein
VKKCSYQSPIRRFSRRRERALLFVLRHCPGVAAQYVDAMRDLAPEVLPEATALIARLRSGLLSEAEISTVVVRLRALLPDPHFMAYTVDRTPEISAEEVVRKAFEYHPFLMPAPPPEGSA